MKSYCIAVPVKKGEEVRLALLKSGLLMKNLAIARSDDFIYMPIIEIEENEVFGFEVIERDFRELIERPKNYKDFVNVPENLRALLPTSFDVVGKVALIKLQDGIIDHKEVIGEAILKANKSIETVAVDSGIEGDERLRQIDIVAGKRSSETIHKEHGIELEIDLFKVYFSPRLATERFRIAQMVEDDEVVIDMFCGVGPFTILIAKYRNPKKIYALDINEHAIHLLKKNIERNKVSRITAILGDSKTMVPDLESADRIIMNLPLSSFEFLSAALSNIKNSGFIHYYEIISHTKKEDRLEDIFGIAKEQNVSLVRISDRAVHTYSPDSSLYCFDMKVRGKGIV